MAGDTNISWTELVIQGIWSLRRVCQAIPANKHFKEHAVRIDALFDHPIEHTLVLLRGVAGDTRRHNVSRLGQSAFCHWNHVVPGSGWLGAICATAIEGFQQTFFSFDGDRFNFPPPKGRSRLPAQSESRVRSVPTSFLFVDVCPAEASESSVPISTLPTPEFPLGFHGRTLCPGRTYAWGRTTIPANVGPTIKPALIGLELVQGFLRSALRTALLSIRTATDPIVVLGASVLSFPCHAQQYQLQRGRASDELWACKQFPEGV